MFNDQIITHSIFSHRFCFPKIRTKCKWGTDINCIMRFYTATKMNELLTFAAALQSFQIVYAEEKAKDYMISFL